MEKILILDTNSLLNRAYYAIRGLVNTSGLPTGAIFGTLKLILDIKEQVQPTKIFAAFDVKKKNFRHDIFPEYKGHRKPMDEDLIKQLQPIKELITLMNIKIVEKEGYEADDVIGTLTDKLVGEKIVLSGDKDLLQLIKNDTTVYLTKVGVSQLEVNDIKELNNKGFRTVEEFIDYKALRGDTSDNIPGVVGIGELTAKKLIAEYSSVENIYANLDTLNASTKVVESLKTNKDICMMSKVLATINKNVPIQISEGDGTYNFENNEFKEKLKELELTTILHRISKKEEIEYKSTNIYSLEGLEKAFNTNSNKVAISISKDITFAFDTSTLYNVILKEALLDEGIYFSDAIETIFKLANNKRAIVFDSKKIFREHDVTLDDYFDLKIGTHLAQYSKEIGESAETMNKVYGFKDNAVFMLYAYDNVIDTLNKTNQMQIYSDMEFPLSKVLLEMERNGISVSTAKLQELERKYTQILNDLTEKIYKSTNSNFNISSPKQMAEVLFEKLKLPATKKNKNGYSVDEEVLQSLVGKHPCIEDILQYRKYSKLLSTYVKGILSVVEENKVHTVFNQCITATGRLSSTNPNMQNIPMRSEESKDIKSAFVADEGCKLISADYSQIELRVLGHLSQDKTMLEAFNSGKDIHTATASKIFNIPIEEVSEIQRKKAKAVNFGIIYGISGFGLSESVNITRKEADEFIEKYFEKYSRVKEYLNEIVSDAREKGYIHTLFGRRRRSTDLKSSNWVVRNQAERIAMNTPIQGTAAEIMKLAMLKVDEKLKGMKSKLILQIHDEIIVEATHDEYDKVCEIIKNSMENVIKLSVPLEVSMSSGSNWGEI